MTAPGRLTCCVPFCRRSTGKAYGEWICGDHWRLVAKRTKARHRQSQRILLRSRERFNAAYLAAGDHRLAQHGRVMAAQALSSALWERCKAEAIERAAGVS